MSEHTALLNSNAELRARLDRLESHAKMPAEQRAQMAQVHQRAEQLGQLHNVPVAPPMPGENLESFTARAFTPFRQFSPAWKAIDLSRAGAALPIAVNEIARDAERGALNDGKLHQVETVDKYSGVKRIEFRGDDGGAMWHAFANRLKIGKFARPSEVQSAAPKASYRE